MRSLLLLLAECAAVLTLVQLCVLNAGLAAIWLASAALICAGGGATWPSVPNMCV
jgi:hypothetical protein